jgi:putative nucleotidyltransferase with HDIG domain
MANGVKKRSRLERVAALELPPGQFLTALQQARRPDVALRLALCVLAAIALWAVGGGWHPPFGYQLGDVPQRDILASVTFKEPNQLLTDQARQEARDKTPYVYTQDPSRLVQLRASLRNSVVTVKSAATFADIDKAIWRQFEPPLADKDAPMSADEEEQFHAFRAALSDDLQLEKFSKAVEQAMAPFERRGLLEKLPPEHQGGNQTEIRVHPTAKRDPLETVLINDVLIGAITAADGQLYQQLEKHLVKKEVTDRVFDWLRMRLVEGTLKIDLERTQELRDEAADAVEQQNTIYQPGILLAKAGEPLGEEQIRLLRLEYDERRKLAPVGQTLFRSLAIVALILTLCIPCGIYIYNRHQPLLTSPQRFSGLLAMVVLTVGLAHWMSEYAWGAELIPLLLLGMTIGIAYSRALALLLSAALAIVLALLLGQGLGSLILWIGVVTAATLQLSRIRHRSKLIQIGLVTGVVAFCLTLLVGLLEEPPLAAPILLQLLTDAGRNALWALLVGFLITGLLPFIERVFGVLTDISLLELGDAAHPLLQELVRRAPGTYNHSINVASIAEAAAESIGARGLLVRVGAYFHDIGKMLKPGYFAENQGPDANRHDTLAPAMSTLIIIAHIKDGADLARQHHLPRPIIDFIEQHHGTTLVEYFYRRASEQSEAEGGTVEESAFRYPGPKPQSREAGILMLADAVESASRVLVEPTPARIEGLVEEIAMKRLLDGQFDECELTLQEIRAVEDSLIKSLNAVYHGRVKYPDQRTA